MNQKYKSFSLKHINFSKISEKATDIFQFKINKSIIGEVKTIPKTSQKEIAKIDQNRYDKLIIEHE